MADWWYSLVGEEDKANAWDGTTLPEKTDFTRSTFLSQFTKRLENRISISERITNISASDAPSCGIGSTAITNVSSASGFITGFVNSIDGLHTVIESGKMPTAGDTHEDGVEASSLCADELAVLSGLNVGDVFWSSEIFEAMYSILEKTKCIAGTMPATNVAVDRYRIRIFEDGKDTITKEYLGDFSVGYYRNERDGDYFQVSIESDAVVVHFGSNGNVMLDYGLFKYGTIRSRPPFLYESPYTEDILYSIGVTGCEVTGAEISDGTALAIDIGDIQERTLYRGNTDQRVNSVGYDLWFYICALSRDDMLDT